MMVWRKSVLYPYSTAPQQWTRDEELCTMMYPVATHPTQRVNTLSAVVPDVRSKWASLSSDGHIAGVSRSIEWPVCCQWQHRLAKEPPSQSSPIPNLPSCPNALVKGAACQTFKLRAKRNFSSIIPLTNKTVKPWYWTMLKMLNGEMMAGKVTLTPNNGNHARGGSIPWSVEVADVRLPKLPHPYAETFRNSFSP